MTKQKFEQRVVSRDITLANGIALSVRAYCKPEYKSNRQNSPIIGFDTLNPRARIVLKPVDADLFTHIGQTIDQDDVALISDTIYGLRGTIAEQAEVVNAIRAVIADVVAKPNVY